MPSRSPEGNSSPCTSEVQQMNVGFFFWSWCFHSFYHGIFIHCIIQGFSPLSFNLNNQQGEFLLQVQNEGKQLYFTLQEYISLLFWLCKYSAWYNADTRCVLGLLSCNSGNVRVDDPFGNSDAHHWVSLQSWVLVEASLEVCPLELSIYAVDEEKWPLGWLKPEILNKWLLSPISTLGSKSVKHFSWWNIWLLRFTVSETKAVNQSAPNHSP